jgi:glycosyltransferase involved in cell wall biosynthesis
MKNLVLTPSISRLAGGLFYSVRRLHQSISDQGVEVRVVGLRDRYSHEDCTEWLPITAETDHQLWHWDPLRISFSVRQNCWQSTDSSTVIHLHGLWTYLSKVCLDISEAKGIPRVISPRGMLDPWALKNSSWKKQAVRFLFENQNLKGAACIHALSESEFESIRKLGLRNPVVVLPNGIDLPEYNLGEELRTHDNEMSSASEGASTRKDNSRSLQFCSQLFPATDGRRILLYLGRLHPKKGLSNLLKAWAILKQSDPRAITGWLLVISGWDQGGHEAALKKLSAHLCLEDHVRFIGPQFSEAKTVAYRLADGFVLPSLSEGLPMTVLEAWVHAKPVVMTTECNLPEGFAAGAALQIRTSPEDIARGLGQLIQMGDLERKGMGECGRNLIAKKFSWPGIAARMKDVYEWVLGGGSAPEYVRVEKRSL